MPNSKHLIFDLDGTIINSKNEIIKTYKKIAEEIIPAKQIQYELLDFGANLNSVLEFIYDGDKAKVIAAKSAFSKIYDNSNFEETFLYEGAVETLSYLKENNYKLHIATNKRHFPTLKILENKNIAQYFYSVTGNEKVKNISTTKKEMLYNIINEFKIDTAFMIGDTTGDIEAGKANNLKTIAVTYGYEPENSLNFAKPDYIAQNIKEIIKFV